jgi:hypothetical protein
MKIHRYPQKNGGNLFYVSSEGKRISLIYRDIFDALEFVRREDEKGRIQEESENTADKNRIL